MTRSSTLPLAEVKAHLSELVSRVNAEHDLVTVTEIARGEGETQEQLAEAMRRRRGSA